MPVVDDHRNLVDAIFWEDVFSENEKRILHNLKLPVVIMAGGKGTRLKPITIVHLKPIIPISEKTIFEYKMDQFVDIGSDQFYI